MTQQPADDNAAAPSWAARAAERSPSVRRSRTRSLQRATQIVQAARRLVATKGADFTTHELVKEAGVAVQTFYKHFGSKDQVLLAVIEDLISEAATGLHEQGQALPDGVARLHFYVTTLVQAAAADGTAAPGARFITAEHWRLHQLYPDELATATGAVRDLILDALHEAVDEGLLKPANPDYDAWLAMQLVMAVYHYYAFAASGEDRSEIADRVWAFCFAAWGGREADVTPARRPFRRTAR